MGERSEQILLTIPEAQLHEVNNGREKLLEWGELEISVHNVGDVSGLWVRVGKTQWSFDSTSPTLKATENTYTFAVGGGRFYSVLLSKGTPPDDAATFEEILVECTAFEVAGALSKQATEETIAEVAEDVANDDDVPLAIVRPQSQPGVKPTTSERIMSGAATVQDKLAVSANWASQKLLEGGKALQAKTQPVQESVTVSPGVASSVKAARKVAEKGNWAANKVAGGLADISVKLADGIVKRLGPNNKYGQQLNDPDTRPGASREVAAAAVVAAVGIFDSMEQAARVVLNSGGTATSEFIGHKYGPQAREVAHDAASASITSGMTVLTVKKIGMRKVAKRIAKRTAVSLVKSYTLGPHQAGSSSGAQQQLQGPSPGQMPAAATPSAGRTQQVSASHKQQAASPMQVTQEAPITEVAPGPIEYRSPFAN